MIEVTPESRANPNSVRALKPLTAPIPLGEFDGEYYYGPERNAPNYDAPFLLTLYSQALIPDHGVEDTGEFDLLLLSPNGVSVRRMEDLFRDKLLNPGVVVKLPTSDIVNDDWNIESDEIIGWRCLVHIGYSGLRLESFLSNTGFAPDNFSNDKAELSLFDWTVYEGSKIIQLPPESVAVENRPETLNALQIEFIKDEVMR